MSKAEGAILALSRGMYGKHITSEQYEQMLSLKSLNEIASYLKDYTPYGPCLEKTAVTNWTSKTLDEAVERYFFTCFNKICKFEIAVGQQMYKYFLSKNEVDQILLCTALISGGKKDDYLKSFNSFLDRYLSIDMFALAKADTLQELSDALKKTPYEDVFSGVLNSGDTTYLAFENAFEAYLRRYQKALVKKCFSGNGRKEVAEAIARQYDVKLIESLTRIIKYYNCNNELLKNIPDGEFTLFTDIQLKKLLLCKNFNQLDSALKKTPYKALALMEKSEDITYDTQKYLFSYYKKQLRFSQNPCVVMLSFFYLCKTEKNNIIKIIEGKKYSLSEEEIRRSLIREGR